MRQLQIFQNENKFGGGRRMDRLTGKVAIITGAGSGMGKATTILFAAEGAKVVAADRVVDSAEEVVKSIIASGGEAVFIKTDVSLTEDVKRMIKTAIETYGKLDILYNNAAIASEWKPTTDWSEENFKEVIDINVKGVWLGMKYAIPEMIKTGGGSIINAASIAADAAQRGSCIYAASKGAVISMSRVTAVEYAAQNIRVNCIKPGDIRTPMTLGVLDEEGIKRVVAGIPQGRLGEPEEVANLALFLASDESSHITGEKITVDGGIEADSHII
jgi:NAD(P)-dependent dehydrogenase (short-subunit alcohol dehydrogenase family)